jgi:hypothetical protein
MKKSIFIALLIACFGVSGLAFAAPLDEKPVKKEVTTTKKDAKKAKKDAKKDAKEAAKEVKK